MPSVSTSRVLPRPGTPVSRAWPPLKIAIRVCVDDFVLADDDLADGIADL